MPRFFRPSRSILLKTHPSARLPSLQNARRSNMHQDVSEALHLPVLDAVMSKLSPPTESLSRLPFSRTAVIYVHHALHSSLPVLRAQFQLGLKPNNTFVLNKSYSECADVVKETKKLGVHYQPCSPQLWAGGFLHAFIRDINLLWNKVILNLGNVDNILIMDHGGHAMSFAPPKIFKKYNVVGVEKTTAGLINPNTEGLPFPIIDVATCAAKKFLESPLISEAVVSKLAPWIPIADEKLVCGVVGYGAIGKAIAKKLLSMGHKVIIYDKDAKKLNDLNNAIFAFDLTAVISYSDYIFGCTGRDMSSNLEDTLRLCPRDKTFISCSSEDVEFSSLIKYIQKQQGKMIAHPFNDIVYKNNMGSSMRIIKGGFPINFDNSGESVPLKDIQLTRALIFCGALQATSFFRKPQLLNNPGRYMLDPDLQKLSANEWFKCLISDHGHTIPQEIVDQFNDKQWITINSDGIHHDEYFIPSDLNDDDFHPRSAKP